MKEHPESKCLVTGYADKGTGNAAVNKRISEKRANAVKAEIVKNYGIAEDRITAVGVGDTEQPYSTPAKNRVAICVVE